MKQKKLMRKSRRLIGAVLSAAATGTLLTSFCAMASQPANQEVTDIDSIDAVEMDSATSERLPVSGWFVKNLAESERKVFVYIPEIAFGRSYQTVVSVPDGEDAVQFLSESGWTDVMDEKGELLFGLVPGEEGWKNAEDEAAYVKEAMSFINSGANANSVTLFTPYGTDYLVGYENGAAPLEAWSAQNPTYVSAQAFVEGTGAGEEFLETAGAVIYNGVGGNYEDSAEGLALLQADLAADGFESTATLKDIPVPTWLAGYTEDDYSLSYWKAVNDCEETAGEDSTFWQAADSASLRTAYANSIYEEDHGISGVKVTEETPSARELSDFLGHYTSYTQNFAYGNHVDIRLPHYEARIAAQKNQVAASEENFVAYEAPVTADSGVVYEGYYLTARERAKAGKGTYESGIIFAADDNGDSTLDASEYLLYIPDSVSAEQKTPVVFQFPGNLQTVTVGADSTGWWTKADEEGFMVVIVGETYRSAGEPVVTWNNPDMQFRAICDVLKKNVDGVDAAIDWTRIYGSGHSFGSRRLQQYVFTHPEFFAAVASTSGVPQEDYPGVYKTIPTMMLQGHGDMEYLQQYLWGSERTILWFEYLTEINDLKVEEGAQDNADSTEKIGRTNLYTWENTQGVPMVTYGITDLRQHNCIPDEVPIMWDFLSGYSKDEDGTRWYSESNFAADDAVTITEADPQ